MKKIMEVLGLLLGVTMGLYLVRYTYEKKTMQEVIELTQKIIENTEGRYIYE